MIPKLPDTDLLSHPPDVDGLDIFSESFIRTQVPSAIGCYAFYYADTGSVAYIGSTCSVGPDGNGFRLRLPFYYGRGTNEKPTSTVVKVREENSRRKLLLRCWACHSPGDCRKYEEDALRKHKPPLNFFGAKTKEWTEESIKLHKLKLSRKAAAKRKLESDYDPTKVINCRTCKIPKLSTQFKKTPYRRFGVDTQCNQCRSEINLRRSPKPCECGCGEITKGGRFVQGHNMQKRYPVITP